jgi:exonuclease III
MQWNVDMRSGTWNVRSLYRACSMETVASKLETCNLDLVAVQEVRGVKGGSQPADDYTSFYGNENTNHHLSTDFLFIRE